MKARASGCVSVFSTIAVVLVLLFQLSRAGVVLGKKTSKDGREVYVVYMGAARKGALKDSVEEEHMQLLYSAVQRDQQQIRDSIVRRYKHGFTGFAARLTAAEARAVSRNPGVVSVFPDPVFQLHTTRSWDFLQLQDSLVTRSQPNTDDDGDEEKESNADDQDEGVVIGLLDTGIWPESDSFSDKAISTIPSDWKGTCVTSHDFNKTHCNKKLIGARAYDDTPSKGGPKPEANSTITLPPSPRDTLGHGTHTASTAAGTTVSSASYYTLAQGTAKGGSPSSHIAVYKVCSEDGCRGSSILAAFDDAISDGVDVLSLSLGASGFSSPDFAKDPIAIGAFHAVAEGVVVVCSAGNDGPSVGTVVNSAPWILTVAATTIDRVFESDVVLGGNSAKAVRGEAVNFSDLDKSPVYPLVSGESARAAGSNITAESARKCEQGALSAAKVKGAIVVCEHSPDEGTYKGEKTEALKGLGAKGVVIADDDDTLLTSVDFPATIVSSKGKQDLLSYINSTQNPVATITPSVTVTKYKPAPAVAYFSSRGPSSKTKNILKPDVAAPGVNILAAWPPLPDTSVVPPGKTPTPFNLLSGTSMSCPHVSGVVASIKAANDWSPAAIRSAIMTTANRANNDGGQITAGTSGLAATPYDYGAGEVNPTAALRPGLVYELETQDYLTFLCNYGYDTATIKLIDSDLDAGFQCPANSSKDRVSDLNYPSIAVSGFGKGGGSGSSRTVTRTVTNVGEEVESTYTATVKQSTAGAMLDVKVVPDKLQFTLQVKKLTYQVVFSSPTNSALKSDAFGTIEWSNGVNRVRTTFVVTPSS